MRNRIPLLLAAVLGLAAPARADFVNPSFETGDFTGWTIANDDGGSGVDTGNSHTGIYYAFLGQYSGDGPLVLSQTVSTVIGQSYTFSFWLSADPGTAAPSLFQASFSGTLVLDQHDIGSSPYTRYAYTVTATSTSSLVEFSSYNDPDYFSLDDVHLAAVPEPTSLGLALIGLAIAAARTRRASKRGHS